MLMECNWDLVRHILEELEKKPGARDWYTITNRGYSQAELSAHLAQLDGDDLIVTPSKDPGLQTDPDQCDLTERGRAQLRDIRKRTKFFEKYEQTQKARRRSLGRL